MSAIHYRPEIDGLRTIAVIPVILFHLGFGLMHGGFAGVDVFFVISGFLITSIIIKENKTGTFKLSRFWARRVRRILPALLAMIAVALLMDYLFGFRIEVADSARHALAAIFSVANIDMWKSVGDYWGGTAENSLFLHCWSLSVEEQFYLFFPITFLLFIRKAPAALLPAMVIASIASFLLFAYGSANFPGATFYLLPTRAWEMGVGCIIAMLYQNPVLVQDQTKRNLLQNAGIILIIASFFILPAGRPSPYLILPVAGTALFILFSYNGNGAARILSSRPFVYIGKISYSLYIWHWPIIVLYNETNPVESHTLSAKIIMFSATFVAAALSYHFIETPMRRKTTPIYPIGIAAAICIAFSLFLMQPSKLEPYDTSSFKRVSFFGHHYNVIPNPPPENPVRTRKMAGVETKLRTPGLEEAFSNDGIVYQYGSNPLDIVVLGDSHAAMWSGTIDEIAQENNLSVSFWTTIGETPLLTREDGSNEFLRYFSTDEKKQFDQARLAAISKNKPLVILSARWDKIKDVDEVERMIKRIGESGSSVLILEQPPVLGIGDRNSAQYIAYLGWTPKKGQFQLYPKENEENVQAGREMIRSIQSRYDHCKIISVYDLFSENEEMGRLVYDDEILYYDDDHISEQGARLAKARITDAIKSMRSGNAMHAN